MVASSAKAHKSTSLSVFSGYAEYSTKLADFKLIYDQRSIRLEASKEHIATDPAFNPTAIMKEREVAANLAELLRQSAQHAVDMNILNLKSPPRSVNVHFDELIIFELGCVANVSANTMRIDLGSVDSRTVPHEFLHLIDPITTDPEGNRRYRGRPSLQADTAVLSELTAEFFTASFLSKDYSGTERTDGIFRFYAAYGIAVHRVIGAVKGTYIGTGTLEDFADPTAIREAFEYTAGGILAIATFTKNNFNIEDTMKELLGAKTISELMDRYSFQR